MELKGGENWPQCGVDFLKKLLEITREHFIQPTTTVSCAFHSGGPIMKDILRTIGMLEEMATLKREYKVSITMDEYTPDEEAAFLILDRISLEYLRPFCDEFLTRFAFRNGLNSTSIICDYVKLLVKHSDHSDYWEDKVGKLIGCVGDVEERLKCVCAVLKHSPVPWSETVTRLYEEGASEKSPEAAALKKERKFVRCKLTLKKYGLKYDHLTKTYINKILSYVFKQGKESMLEDALSIVNSCEGGNKLELQAHALYVQRLIENNASKKALSYLDDESVSADVVLYCCDMVVTRAKSLLDYYGTPIFPSDHCEKYCEILDLIGEKARRAAAKLGKCGGDGGGSLHQHRLVFSPSRLKHLYQLRVTYKVNAELDIYVYDAEKEKIMKICCEKIMNEYCANLDKFGIKRSQIDDLARCLEVSSEEIYKEIVKTAAEAGKYEAIPPLVKRFLKGETFGEDVCAQAVDMAAHLWYHFSNREGKGKNQGNDGILKSIRDAIAFGLCEYNGCAADSGMLRKALDILSWCRILSEETNAMDTISNLTKCDKRELCFEIHDLRRKTLDYISGDVDGQCNGVEGRENRGNFVVNALQGICNKQQDMASFRIIVAFHWFLSECLTTSKEPFIGEKEACLAASKAMATNCVQHLLCKSISFSNPDLRFALILLRYYPLSDAKRWIIESLKKATKDFQRLRALSEIAVAFYAQNRRLKSHPEILKVHKQCIWAKRLQDEYRISYKEAFRDSVSDQKQLLHKLFAVPSVTLDVLRKYCKDANFDFQQCLIMYLKHLFLSWEPSYEAVAAFNSNVVTELKLKSAESLGNQCRKIAALCTDKGELLNTLVNAWDSVNYYHYEIFLILISLMEGKGIKPDMALYATYRSVLFFLHSYIRISEPQEFERESWHQCYPNTQKLPEISKYRLPFRLLFKKWTKDSVKIISHELNFSTYTKWFTIMDMLDLDKNTICTYTVNRITAEDVIGSNEKDKWCVRLKNQKLLKEVEICVSHMTNLETVSACLYFVANNLPPGADQLAAAKMCYTHAKEWLEMNNVEVVQKRFHKVRNKYLSISASHTLHAHALGKAEYLQLVLKPSELIPALYHDEAIPAYAAGTLSVIPDIHKAAEEIAKLYRENLKKMRTDLVDEWLQPELSFRLNKNGVSDIGPYSRQTTSNHTFERICYVLERDPATFGPYLGKIAFEKDGGGNQDVKPVGVVLKAAKCLYSTLDAAILEELSGMNAEDSQNYLKNLTFVSELENYGVVYSLSRFVAQENKGDMVGALLSLQDDNAGAVCFAVKMCRSFEITTPAIWNVILTRMINSSMYSELAGILPDIADYDGLEEDTLKKAWQTALATPLLKASRPLSKNDAQMVEKCVHLAFFCPCLEAIDLHALVKCCLRIERHDLVKKIESLID